MDSESKLRPVTLGFDRQYLSIDLSKIRTSVAELVAVSGAYFSKPLDDVWFEVIKAEGMLAEQIPSSDTTKAFDLVEADTLLMKLHLSVSLKTANLGLTKLPEEFVNLSIDFHKRRFMLEVTIAGLEKANRIGELLTEGVALVNVELPPGHRYIEPILHKFLREHPSTEQNV